ncbi:BgTH12-07100 [Blumeria graminis f. sp. triticale]|uniref:Mitochondrial-processing peptidase subunit alpha n=3 Tax=Blumeria graminis TaxID=34373 RepID=A0A061HGY6_BLUGR|nr:Larger subunit of the mitochondrial processing protease (MPP) [Blumeria graminis f. sp. tritici 96224]CAD6506170.1 BgTH12-07100 [Blumeria graminis f. sp. triticale]VDB94870.1 Bgt-4180 [Blumeria graminis f. sp. tritici]
MWKSLLSRALPRVSCKAKFIRNASPIICTRNLATSYDPIQKDPAELDEVSTLANGIRVATEALPGHFSGIGVFIDAGSRYENEHLRGVSHIMDRLAFKSTKNRTSDQMLEAIESLGGNINCASSRESLMYQSATFNSAVPTAVALLAETIRDPLITEEEVQEQLETAAYEIKEIWSKPELILPEVVHMAAYKDNTLGNPLLCPKERFSEIDKKTVNDYRSALIRPDRIVLAFAGVPHEEALKLADQYFADMPTLDSTNKNKLLETTEESSQDTISEITTTSPNLMESSTSRKPLKFLSRLPFLSGLSSAEGFAPKDPSLPEECFGPSHYTGGFLSLPNLPRPVNATRPSLTHIHLAFESLSISSDDIYALATLQILLGGGGSFSAGGPGKGMYSRLYTNVLNQHGWVESCAAFNHSYIDSGLFGIAASCSPSHVALMLNVMCRELQALTLDTGYQSLQAVEVNRAKNQLRSSLLMNLESRMVELEDLGRQIQVHGKKIGVREMCSKIEKLTIDDLRRVAKIVVGGMVDNPGMGSGAPTVVLQECDEEGPTRQAFKWEQIQDCIASWKLGKY